MSIEQAKAIVAKLSTKQLLVHYNELLHRATTKFADRKAGEKQVLKALEKDPEALKYFLGEHKDDPATPAPSAPTPAVAVEDEKPSGPLNGEPRRRAKAVASTTTDRAAATAKSWKNKDVAAARAIKSRVKVAGKEYRSVREAFIELGLPEVKHVRFRLELKAAGKAVFEHEGKKTTFSIVAGE